MLGQIRASSSSLESLERATSSKILKDDSLSIYEATLVKLKLGSQHNLSSPSEQVECIDSGSVLSSTCIEPMRIDVNSTTSLNEEVSTMDTNNLSLRTHPSSRLTNSARSSKQQDERIVSIFYLFSKFKNAQNAVSSSSEDSMTVEKGGHSVSTSPSFSSCQSLDSTEQ